MFPDLDLGILATIPDLPAACQKKYRETIRYNLRDLDVEIEKLQRAAEMIQ